MISAVFSGTSPDWSGRFQNPRALHCARSHHEVADVVRRAERAARDGHWVVLLIAYEAASAMDAALRTHALTNFPLATALIFDASQPVSPATPASLPQTSWTPLVPRTAYEDAVSRILAYIAAGDTYQVNFTFPMVCQPPHALSAWYSALSAAQAAPFSCHISLPEFSILSFSPELFFARIDSTIIARPMKGTLPRGRWLEEDLARRSQLGSCLKNRAENLMIVDMVRNDLGRIATIGSVRVPTLFSVEPYPTVLQMTSTISAHLTPSTTLWDILRALFPCASITGAPKVRTMAIIRELERYPRGIYTGAIGLLQPGGNATFSVPIRTILCDHATQRAFFAVGGGIVADSNPTAEYEECLTKAAFLHTPRPYFELLESLLLRDGAYWLLPEHLARLRASAAYFGFPYDEAAVRCALNEVAHARVAGSCKVRLVLAPSGRVTADVESLPSSSRPWVLAVAPNPVSSRDVFLFHKTTHRLVYDHALHASPACDDVILWNELGEITETTRANIVIEHAGQRLTPSRESGLLAGTFRAALLARGELQEKRLTLDDLARASRVWLINSVRGWIEVDMPRLRAALASHQQACHTCGTVRS